MGMMTSLTKIKKAEGLGETLKLGAGFVIGLAADIAITALLKGRIPPGKGFTRLMIKLGVFAIAMKTGEDVENYFYKVVDDTKEAYQEISQEAKKAVQEAITEQEEPPALP